MEGTRGKCMMKSRWLSLILAIVMTAVAFPAGFSIYGEENIEMVEKLFITYENLKTTTWCVLYVQK